MFYILCAFFMLLDIYGGCGPDLTGSSMGLTINGVKLMVDSGEFQGSTSSAEARRLVELRNNFGPKQIWGTHGHVDHVIGGLFQREFGSLPKDTKYITNEIIAQGLKTIYPDGFGLQQRKLRTARAVNQRRVGLLREQKNIRDLIDILNVSGMDNTDDITDHYAIETENRIASAPKKNGVKSIISDFLRKHQGIPPKALHKSTTDLQAMLYDVEMALQDYSDFRVDYSWKSFSKDTVDQVLKRTKGILYNQPHVIDHSKGIIATLYRAGHTLGSSQILFESSEHPNQNICFSGDVRVSGNKFLPGFEFIKNKRINTLVLESTYGNRLHTQSYNDAMDQIADLQNTAKGDCLTATISYQRGPENLVNILKGKHNKVLYYGRTLYDFRALFLKYGGEAFRTLNSSKLEYCMDVPADLGSGLSRYQMVAPSGMLHGRSADLAARMANNPKSRIILTNFLPEHSPGYELLHNKRFRTELGDRVDFKGEVFHVSGTSGHGDQNELVKIAVHAVKQGATNIVLNHGGDQRISLEQAIKAHLHKEGLPQVNIIIPQNGDQIDLKKGKIVNNLLNK